MSSREYGNVKFLVERGMAVFVDQHTLRTVAFAKFNAIDCVYVTDGVRGTMYVNIAVNGHHMVVLVKDAEPSENPFDHSAFLLASALLEEVQIRLPRDSR